MASLAVAMRDPDALVRNNAMRVLADVARYQPGVEIPLDALLVALDDPTMLDRKVAATLDGVLTQRGAAATQLAAWERWIAAVPVR